MEQIDDSSKKDANVEIAIKKATHSTKSNDCNQCGYATSHAGHLKTHLKTHSGEKSDKCNQCDYACSDPSALRTHMKTSPQAKRHKPSLLFTSLTILTFITR